MKKVSIILIALAITFLGINLSAALDKRDVGKDHPLFSRFPGTYISFHTFAEFEDFLIAKGKMPKFTARDALPQVLRLPDMKTTTIEYYSKNKTVSAERIYRNYKSAFNKLGLQEIFSCSNDSGCGKKFLVQMYWYGNKIRQSKYRMFGAPNAHGTSVEYRYWAGTGIIKGKKYYITLAISKRANWPAVTLLDISEPTGSIDTNLIKTNLDMIVNSINNSGKVVLGGILFDTNKTSLKPTSMEVIKIVATYMQQNPTKAFYVVGHTDSDGQYNFNLELSQGRARSVVDQLSKAFGIQASRLTAVGIGPVSPLEKNSTSGGRAKNRRVELVER